MTTFSETANDTAKDFFDPLDNAKEHADDIAAAMDRPQPHLFTSPQEALHFITAGNAYFTLRSKKTGTRFTFRMAIPKRARKESRPIHYVSLLNGPDNEHNYSYLGLFTGNKICPSPKSLITRDAPSYKAIEWTLKTISAGRLPDMLEIWHEGRCGRCGRKLTVPESIAAGIGPECARKVAA